MLFSLLVPPQSQLLDWETIRGIIVGGGGWWIFSSAVGTMPKPLPMERWYGWMYLFLQLVAANHGLRKAAANEQSES